MGGEWTSRPLRDCAVWYSGGTPSKGNPDYWNGDIPWISAKSLTEFFVGDSEDRVTEAGANNGTRLVPKDTVLFIVRGMSLKSEFRMGITTRPVTFNQDLKALVAVDDVVPAFLAYAIKARTPEILGFVGEAGHGTGVLPTDRIQGLEIPLPPVDEQRAIAHILGTLDDKIELNRRTNETLEAMARALFKSWFVDFDPVRAKAQGQPPPGMDPATAALFPSELQDSELGKIPKGWRATTWGELVELAYGKALRDYKSGSGPVEVFGTNGPIGWTDKPLAEEPTVIIGRKGAYRGVHFAAGSSWTIDTAFFLQPKRPIQVRWAYYAIRQHDINEMDSGSAIPSTSRDAFYALGAIEAPPSIQDAFQRVLAPVWDKQAHNAAESQRLGSIRDALLPRLLSGELSVAQAEQAVEATA